jgi:hypothetical protein
MSTTSLSHVIPRTVWVLGFVSLCMDLSSEMVHSLLPVFLVSTLGASALTVGAIEGLAEATALIVKVFSGAVSDVSAVAKVCCCSAMAWRRSPNHCFRWLPRRRQS